MVMAKATVEFIDLNNAAAGADVINRRAMPLDVALKILEKENNGPTLGQ